LKHCKGTASKEDEACTGIKLSLWKISGHLKLTDNNKKTRVNAGVLSGRTAN